MKKQNKEDFIGLVEKGPVDDFKNWKKKHPDVEPWERKFEYYSRPKFKPELFKQLEEAKTETEKQLILKWAFKMYIDGWFKLLIYKLMHQN